MDIFSVYFQQGKNDLFIGWQMVKKIIIVREDENAFLI